MGYMQLISLVYFGSEGALELEHTFSFQGGLYLFTQRCWFLLKSAHKHRSALTWTPLHFSLWLDLSRLSSFLNWSSKSVYCSRFYQTAEFFSMPNRINKSSKKLKAFFFFWLFTNFRSRRSSIPAIYCTLGSSVIYSFLFFYIIFCHYGSEYHVRMRPKEDTSIVLIPNAQITVSFPHCRLTSWHIGKTEPELRWDKGDANLGEEGMPCVSLCSFQGFAIYVYHRFSNPNPFAFFWIHIFCVQGRF